MAKTEKNSVDSTGMDLKELRGELCVIIPFFLASLGFFLGSFTFKRGAGGVPMAVGFITLIMTGMRLFHIIRPQSKIGEFNETGLAGEFDQIKDEFKEETLKDHLRKTESKEVTFAVESKAFIGIIGSFFIFLLFGYIVGCMITIVWCSYYYGYREKLPIAIVVASLFFIVYVVLYKLMEAPADFGMLLEPILTSLNII